MILRLMTNLPFKRYHRWILIPFGLKVMQLKTLSYKVHTIFCESLYLLMSHILSQLYAFQNCLSPRISNIWLIFIAMSLGAN